MLSRGFQKSDFGLLPVARRRRAAWRPGGPVRARPRSSRRVHFNLDPFCRRRCRAAPDQKAREEGL